MLRWKNGLASYVYIFRAATSSGDQHVQNNGAHTVLPSEKAHFCVFLAGYLGGHHHDHCVRSDHDRGMYRASSGFALAYDALVDDSPSPLAGSAQDHGCYDRRSSYSGHSRAAKPRAFLVYSCRCASLPSSPHFAFLL